MRVVSAVTVSVAGAKLALSAQFTVFESVGAAVCDCSLVACWALEWIYDTRWAIVINRAILAACSVEYLTSITNIAVPIKLQVVARGPRWARS
jgi:hypothetical protein